MVDSCPISGQQADSNVCRAVAALVVAGALLAALLKAPVVLVALAADFLIRGSDLARRSPLFLVARGTLRLLAVPPHPVDRAPKRFAARIGALLTTAAAVLLFVGFPVAAMAVLGILAVCATLEAAFGFCVGCRMYSALPAKVAETIAR